MMGQLVVQAWIFVLAAGFCSGSTWPVVSRKARIEPRLAH